MNRFALTDEQVEHYRIEGYVVLSSLFDAGELRRLDETMGRLIEQALATGSYEKLMELEPQSEAGAPVPRRIYHPYEQHKVFRELAEDPRLLDRLQSLIGPDIAFHHSKLNMKPAKVGSVVDWHQDLAYFPHTNDDLVTTLIYLDDATEQNGCLQILPRQHKRFFDHCLPDGTFAGMVMETIDDGRFGSPLALPAPAGSVIFMHCIMPHSSLPNCSEQPRRTLIFEYRAADSFPIYFNDHVQQVEARTHHLRGQPARFARFGGPAPPIPRLPGQFQSLYKLQEEAREALSQ